MAGTDMNEILRAVRDVDFPAGKEELVTQAKRAGASQAAIKALRGIPPDQYRNRSEVARSVRLPADAGSEVSPAVRAEQAREGGRPRQSQWMRDVPEPPVQEELDR
ncbi:DUF2795 domain-containing protein [Streptomyces radicis]|uniref:DUF2795 domain-containing protein n=1 Tax=Streptomyces radicis TaxID=1750517 RepID=A0A3A9WFY0_9ACTN|nr:DUF2795 domain-containing protein [Streptomyces radicis]RKN11522.1 DUF2795 domain-containing protein [Streptomyces radicis]RKN26459.1 DUF2795 domain-containing protein [Streptomyces radicis]